MKPHLHVANTFFESELERPWTGKESPEQALARLLQKNPVFLQLQFLPFLYAKEGDAILVSHMPDAGYAAVRKRYGLPDLTLVHIHDASLAKNFQLIPWGHSQLLGVWSLSHGLEYTMPSWSVVQEVNSKAFSFLNSPRLPQAELLFNSQDADRWLKATSGKRVLKTCFGVSARGHLHVESDSKRIAAFLDKQWQQHRPVIAEPWVDRVLDFSTQWILTQEKEIIFVGSTLCHNTAYGQYRSNCVGDETILFGPHLPHLGEHKSIARKVLETMADKGYFGHVGIDAMLYRNAKTGGVDLHPIVEINARKTMGWVALAFQQVHYAQESIEFSLDMGADGLLPSAAIARNGQHVPFERNVHIRLLA